MTQTNPVAQNDETCAQQSCGNQFFVPAVDIFETDNELTLYADVPGVAPKDVELSFENGELILQGHVSAPQRTGKLLAGEYREGDFYRVFQVHESIDASRIEAECSNGVLTVHLPKEEKVKPRKVAVKAGN